jgi:hypothetical protein
MNPGKKIGELSVSQLIKVLEPHFLATSLGSAPGALGSAGGRATNLTTDTVQVLLASLVNGVYVWRFSNPYNNPPIISVLPVGAGAVDSRLYLAETVTKFAAKIASHDATDRRVIHLIAIGAPN